ncbi:hypothetical protein M5X00_13490 [Paenibacillus alvei]|uniref:hypothetical protein n=1 Tax=Paenibacillus alvei TaxID=44250 RepID=UPI000289B713|nr:hypothetical protein [Paenibacillus alvei]EJW13855.1 hypothetical protein PAV_109p00850 [Paenibacillus alvei DSM 29]MCY9545193.1 hypothetical protein [Paenibacillus alvei]MCY9708333.1 hypothetical protein [Paenibacillus alvei]MCY9732979.1 hypothetical protein [Paenibacillus alvei]MCY9755255.1 hypothetical protein [Paenibacillus alvei]
MRQRMPWILEGRSTFVRNRLLKAYSLDQLECDDTWYKEVIEAPECDFFGIHRDDLELIYHYFSPSDSELISIQNKYGNCDLFTVVIAKLTELYDRAYQNAIKKLQVV